MNKPWCQEAPDHTRNCAKRMRAIREGIAEYLDRVIRENQGFPGLSYYGESFSYWLLRLSDNRYAGSLSKLRELYAAKDQESPKFTWEFNKYAWVKVFNFTHDEEIRELAYPLRFRYTPATNWVLLRCCTQIMAGQDVAKALRDAKAILGARQSSSGLICDDSGVRSLQYHCFSAVLTAEIYLLCQDHELKQRFIRSAEFIRNFILRTGDTLYIGRGQQQSFGYGALIYLLALAGYLLKDPSFLDQLERCLSFLSRFQRQDGSFPLVMNTIEKTYPLTADPTDQRYPGWYAYNSYFDYLPFLGVMLSKAEQVLASIEAGGESWSRVPSPGTVPPESYQDTDFLIVRRPSYEAVLAKPGGGWRGGGLWTNDLPMPYLVHRGRRLTPSYGGEQYGPTMYDSEGIPLPLVQSGGESRSMRDGRLWSFWCGHTLIVFTLKALLIRRFDFGEEHIIIRDKLISPCRTYPYYLFEELQEIRDGHEFSAAHGTRVLSRDHLCIEPRKRHFWGGTLEALRSSQPSRFNTLTISLEAVK
jgi:hypothetical protein